jgi:hypothetical protein
MYSIAGLVGVTVTSITSAMSSATTSPYTVKSRNEINPSSEAYDHEAARYCDGRGLGGLVSLSTKLQHIFETLTY